MVRSVLPPDPHTSAGSQGPLFPWGLIRSPTRVPASSPCPRWTKVPFSHPPRFSDCGTESFELPLARSLPDPPSEPTQTPQSASRPFAALPLYLPEHAPAFPLREGPPPTGAPPGGGGTLPVPPDRQAGFLLPLLISGGVELPTLGHGLWSGGTRTQGWCPRTLPAVQPAEARRWPEGRPTDGLVGQHGGAGGLPSPLSQRWRVRFTQDVCHPPCQWPSGRKQLFRGC